MKQFICIIALAIVACHARTLDHIETPRLSTSDELLSAVISKCFGEPGAMDCMKVNVLSYLDTVVGVKERSARSFSSANIDKVIFDRVGRILNNNEFKVKLPEALTGAEVTYSSSNGLDFNMPSGEGRGLLKKKLLLPILLLFKLKMKMLMPIFVALIGLKAMKALILSKVAILLVVGFIVAQLLKKGGMPMAMAMTPAPEPTPPSTAYGPAVSAPATPADSYSPSWEPASQGGPYARWDTSSSAQGLAYSAYYPGSSSGSSSSSYSSPSSSSSGVSISTASGTTTY